MSNWEPVCKVNEFVDKLQQFSVSETKILLSKGSDGKFYATSHLCTHYKAPLAKAAFMEDRIVCQWHGACFNIKDGNIEDGPALDSLKSYPVKEENGTIYVDISKESQRLPKKVKSLTDKVVVIVGFGPTSLVAAEQLRKQDFKGRIKVIAPDLPIDTPKLSKVGTSLPDRVKLQLRDEQHFKDLSIEWIKSKAASVDQSVKAVVLENNMAVDFDFLILATGSYARELPFLKGFSNSFTLRTYECASKISQSLSNGKEVKNIVICGSSFIGLECAAAFSNTKHKITVVGMESAPLEVVLGKEVGQAVQLLHEKNGIQFQLEDTIERVDSSNNEITAVHLKSGKSMPCDIIVAGIGAIPNTLYLEKHAKFQINGNKSLNTNEFLQVSGFENVFAGGDIATYPANGQPTRIEHWNVAQNHGRVIANNIVLKLNKQALQPFKHIPYFWTVQFGKSIRYCGRARPVKVIVQGNIKQVLEKTTDVGDLKFRAYYADENGQVGAVASLMWDPTVSHASELFRNGKMPNLDILGKSEILDLPPRGTHRFNLVLGVNGVPNSRSWIKLATAVVGIAISVGWYLNEKNK